jgi:hypothetical protein
MAVALSSCPANLRARRSSPLRTINLMVSEEGLFYLFAN